MTEDGLLFDEARDRAEGWVGGCRGGRSRREDTVAIIRPERRNEFERRAMPHEPPRDPPLPQQQRRDLRKILVTAAFFLFAFGGGAAVGLMAHRSDGGGSSDSARVSASYVEPAGGGADDDVSSGGGLTASTDDTPAAGANGPPTGLLRSTRSPSPTQSLQPVTGPLDTSGAWYSVQSSPSSAEEGAALQSDGTSSSSPTDESTTLQLNGTVIPLQNGTTAPTGNNDSSTSSSIIATQSTNDPTPTPQTIDVSSWIYEFNSSLHPTMMMTTTPPSSATMKPTTTTTSTELDDVTSNSTTTTTTTESSINLDNWVDAFNAIAVAGGAAPCLTDEACDAQRQSMGFVYYEVGD